MPASTTSFVSLRGNFLPGRSEWPALSSSSVTRPRASRFFSMPSAHRQ